MTVEDDVIVGEGVTTAVGVGEVVAVGVDTAEALKEEDIEVEPVSELVRDGVAPGDKVGEGVEEMLEESDKVLEADCEGVCDVV